MKLLHKSGREIELDTLSTLKNLAIYPGSFNPLHEGHKGIYQLLRRQGFDVVFEMSKSRFQKPAYSEQQFNLLVKQFEAFADLLISDAPLFSQKRDQLSRFNPFWVMGYDTARRWIEENRKVDAAEQTKIAAMQVIFIGRLSEGVYHDPTTLLDGSERYHYQILHFRCDISSTEIRKNQQP